MAKGVNYYFIKAVRISGWVLLGVIILVLASGYVLCGRFGLGRWFDEQQAGAIHRQMDVPLLAVLAVHVLPSIYLAVWRSRWVQRRINK